MKAAVSDEDIMKFPVSANPADREILLQWKWLTLRTWEGDWDAKIKWCVSAAQTIVTFLESRGLRTVVSFFGQFTTDGVLAVANALMGERDVRFYLPSVTKLHPGRGYVDTFVGIEGRHGCVERLGKEAQSALGDAKTLYHCISPTRPT